MLKSASNRWENFTYDNFDRLTSYCFYRSELGFKILLNNNNKVNQRYSISNKKICQDQYYSTSSAKTKILFIYDFNTINHYNFIQFQVLKIHCNARLYDPVKKMFLTPDNILQDPYNPQNYNKFGYCLNNPLKYTDPSGNEFVTAALFVSAGIGAIISGLFYVAQNAYNQQGFDWSGLGLSMLQGAVSGAAAYGIGSAFTTASVVAALGKTGTIFAQAAAHGLSQATISGIFKGDFSNFGSDFAAGAVSSLVGSGISKLQIDNPALRKLTMYLGGAISGGLAASITGGDFLDGAATGLIVTALNHGLHEVFDGIVSEQQKKQFIKQIKNILKELNIDISKLDVLEVTTDAPPGYDITKKGQYIEKATGKIELAITEGVYYNENEPYTHSIIHLSPQLLSNGSNFMIEFTLYHELGHALDFKFYNKSDIKLLFSKPDNILEIRANNHALKIWGNGNINAGEKLYIERGIGIEDRKLRN